jgi:hypothetical protein
MPADFPARKNFYRCFIQRSAEHFFVSSVLFADEAPFGTDDIINIHNKHHWAEEYDTSRRQHQFGRDC